MDVLQALILTVITAATPLLLAGVGEAVVERSGVLNLGVEGMMVMGAVSGFGAAYLSPHMRDLYVFGILIAVLLLKPSGLFGKAVVGALKAFPMVNAEIQGDEMVIKHYYDIGVAVGVEEGLVVPVVRDVDKKSFAQIEKEIGDLAKKARDGTLSIADLQGGTFTITNGGVYGSLMSTPILNAPQVGILGMHKIEERAVVVGGQVVVRPMMYLALSYDHRLIDGSTAVRFLVRVKELIEDPEALLLEG